MKDRKTDSPSGLPSLIDTHCHLDLEQFEGVREEVISRAMGSGIEAMVTVASDLKSNARVIEIASMHPSVFAAVGVHPHDSKDFNESTYEYLRNLASEKKVVAIGETGLDYHYDHSPRDVQRAVFLRHLELAKECGLPVIVHSREAKDDTLAILRESGIDRGVLHCFSGDREMAERVLMMGFYVSFAGPVTFRKASDLREIVRIIPDDYLLVETDAPYLSPVPLRGKRNEPAHVIHTIRALAEARGIAPEDIARITTLNAKRLFRIGQIPSHGEITYKIRDSLYLNITNRCTNLCSFCVRLRKDFVKGHNLRLSQEPSAEDLKKAIGDPAAYREVVFCGYGEPLLRLDLIKDVALWIKDHGGSVRINTNGHGNLIYGRNILPELRGLVDAVSISLDAHNAEVYNELCKPVFRDAFSSVLEFAREAGKNIPRITMTVVDTGGVDIEKSRRIAQEIGAEFRVRRLDDVG